MLNNKIKYIALFIILLLSMNAFSATNFTDDSSETTLQSSSSDKVAADADNAADDGNGDSAGADNSNNANTGDNKSGKTSFGGNGTGFNFGNTSFGGNGSGFSFGNTSFGNGSSFNFNRSGSNSSSFDFASILDYVKKMMGGDNETNVTNETTNPEVSDVPRVVTSTSYSPVSKIVFA